MMIERPTMASLGRQAADEIAGVLSAVRDEQVDSLRTALVAAPYILTYGVGREGLVMRSFAMRLMHLGLPVGVVGDMTAGPLTPNSLFVCSAGPGHFSTVAALMEVARNSGAGVALFTAHPESPLVQRATHVIETPAHTLTGSRTGAASRQIMGSVYEQSLWVLLDCVIWQMAQELGRPQSDMAQRHTNME